MASNTLEEIKFCILLDNVSRLQHVLSLYPNVVSLQRIFESGLKKAKVSICKYCLRKGVRLDELESCSAPLMQVIKTKSTTEKELYLLLLENGVDPNQGDGNFTPVEKAIVNQDLDLLHALVEYGVDLDWEGPNGLPLWYALKMNSIAVFRKLVELGATVTLSQEGKNLLHYICEHREIKDGVLLAKLLIDHQIELECVSTRGMTPFLHACYYGRVDLMRVFVDSGCNIEARNIDDRNALEIIVDSPHAPYHVEAVIFAMKLGLDARKAKDIVRNLVSKIESPLYIELGNIFKINEE